MDARAAKLAIARRKLRDHQEKKSVYAQKDDNSELSSEALSDRNDAGSVLTVVTQDEEHIINDYIVTSDIAQNTNNHEKGNTINDKSYVDVAEILISNKTNLEIRNKELEAKISQLDQKLSLEISLHNTTKQKNATLESELNDVQMKYVAVVEAIKSKDDTINELQNQNKLLTDENNNLIEQQEFTKSMLRAKETEAVQLNSQISSLQHQIEVAQLQLQQLTNDTNLSINQGIEENKNEILYEKISILEQQLDNSVKEKDHINSHYEHYVSKINEQLRVQTLKNESLLKEVTKLKDRENTLVEQISQMEIRVQSYRNQSETLAQSQSNHSMQQLKNKLMAVEADLEAVTTKYNDLQKHYEVSIAKIQELNERIEQEYNHPEIISITKLNADIASDKIAAQRATEQNKKLKTDIEELEQIVVKMGKDKLELTEKFMHEKDLNKGLILKVAEIDEKSKHMQEQLLAKDEEMIRLQTNYRDIEHKHEALLENVLQTKENAVSRINKESLIEHRNNGVTTEENKENIPLIDGNKCAVGHSTPSEPVESTNIELPKQDAMHKLQERFLNIMDQVANLSDEKHRLEHIILQLQTETDTICEYVALYQQQRSLLKKRDEERGAQIKVFQMECDQLKRQLEELSGIFLKLARDKELSLPFQEESRHNDLNRIKKLLADLLNNSLISSKCKSLELNNFYPCSCCSGQLIDV